MRRAEKKVWFGVISGMLLFLGITGINTEWAVNFGIAPVQYPLNFVFLIAGGLLLWKALKR